MKSILLVHLIVFYTTIATKAQTEYLVTVNTSTGTYTKVDSLPGVKWVSVPSQTFDNLNQRYIFKGADSNFNWFLYSIDVNTGNILSSPSFPVFNNANDNILNLEFSNYSNKLFALHWNSVQSKEYLVSIDTETGLVDLIDSLPGVKWVQNEKTFDNINNRYIFKGADANMNWYLYSVNADNGNIVFNPPYPSVNGNLTDLQFSSSTNTLYALHWDNSTNTEFLSTIDPVTGVLEDINILPGVEWITTSYATFDDFNQNYSFNGGDGNGNWYLYTVDAQSGNVLSSPSFPVLSDPNDNVLMLEASSLTGIYYAVHWEADTDYTGIEDHDSQDPIFSLSPNPYSHNSRITLDKQYTDILVFVYNTSGQVVKKIVASNTSEINISRDNLTNGQYYISVVCDHLCLGTIKATIH